MVKYFVSVFAGGVLHISCKTTVSLMQVYSCGASRFKYLNNYKKKYFLTSIPTQDEL